MLETVLGIDPGGKGGHTGIVLVGYSNKKPAHPLDSWAVPDDTEGFVQWWRENRDVFQSAGTVVCEHFVNRNVRGADLTPCFVEGAVVALSQVYRLSTPVMSPASGKNTAVPDSVLKAAGLYFPGDHHRDRTEAARHAMRWLRNKRHMPTLTAYFKKG